MPSDNSAVIFSDAADYIEKHGWVQGSYYDTRSRAACIVGAVLRAMNGGVGIGTGAETSLAYNLDGWPVLLDEIGCSSAEEWNDDLGRKQWEAVDALRNASKRLQDGPS